MKEEQKFPKPNELGHNLEYTEEEIAAALRRNDGLQILAADEMGMNYCWMSVRINGSDFLKSVKRECLERRKDRYERLLDKKAQEESLGAIIYFLKTMAKDRGYGEDAKTIMPAETLNTLATVMSYYNNLQSSRKIDDTTKANE